MTDDPGAAALTTARAFLDAIVEGDDPLVWEMLHRDARELAVRVALHQGLDRVKARRFVDGNADPAELAEFQRDLVGGLRRDFRSVELERLTVGATTVVDSTTEGSEPGDVTVELSSPSDLPGTAGWYAGRLRLRYCAGDDGRWQVVEVEPTVAGP